MPYEPDPGQDAPEPERRAYHASREVRHTVILVIPAHLKDGAALSWQGLSFDFTGAVFDGGDFSPAAGLSSLAPSSPVATLASLAPGSLAPRSVLGEPRALAAGVASSGASFQRADGVCAAGRARAR